MGGVAAGKPYYYISGDTGGKLPWKHINGSLVQVSVGDDGSVWGISKHGAPYYLQGNQWIKLNMGEIQIQFYRISCGSKEIVWGINRKGQVYQWNGVEFSLKPPPLMRSISAAADGTVWAVTKSAGTLYSWTKGTWKQRTQPKGRVISVAVEDDDEVWVVTNKGKVLKWDGEENVWNSVNGKLVTVEAAANNVWGLDQKHQIFKLKKDALVKVSAASQSEIDKLNAENAKKQQELEKLSKKMELISKQLNDTATQYELKLGKLLDDYKKAKEERDKAAEQFVRATTSATEFESDLV